MNKKIIVENVCEEVENDDIAGLADTLTYYASIIGGGSKMSISEVILSILFASEDMIIHMISMNEIMPEKVEELRQKAKDLAYEKQDKLEKNGTMDKIKKIKEEHKQMIMSKKKEILS